MNSKASVNPTSIKWLAEDEQIVADYFLDLGFLSLKEILDKVRKFDQVSRLQLFLYHIWKRCKSGRDLDNFYTISMSDSKEM